MSGESIPGTTAGAASGAGVPTARDLRIDALRALAIALVVAGHAALVSSTSLHATAGAQVFGSLPGGAPLYITSDGFGSFVPNLIYVFHMPLFAFLSGYVLHGREGDGPVRLVWRRFVTLMIPYFAWLLVGYAYLGAPRPLPGFVWAAVVDAGAPGALWFLYALFECFAFFALFRWLPGWRYWLVGATAVFTVLVVQRPYSTLLGLGYMAWILPFFVMGYFVARSAERIEATKSRGVWIAAALAVLTVPIAWPVLGGLPRWWSGAMAAFYAAHPGTRGAFALTILGGPVARYVSAAACVMLCYYLYGLLPGRLLAAQQAIGRNSLGIYAIHGFALYALYWAGVRWWPVSAALALAGAYGLTVLLGRSRLLARLTLGQRR